MDARMYEKYRSGKGLEELVKTGSDVERLQGTLIIKSHSVSRKIV